MGEKATQDKDVKVENPQDNPDPNPNPQPDPADELQRENEQLKKQLSDKDSFITNLSSEKATLEARLQQKDTQPVTTDQQQEVQGILEKAQIDPASAAKDLANLLKRTTDSAQQTVLQNLQPMIQQNLYAAELKSKNKDVLDFFGEEALALNVQKKMQAGKTFQQAADEVVGECKKKMDSLKSKATLPTPPEAGAESGSNKPPEPTPPPKEETQEDEIARRQRERAARGL